MIDLTTIRNTDPAVCDAMEKELARQRGNLELIASENIVSPAVMAAMGSHLTNKYAEGYPGKRYYGGCEFVDVVEDLARSRMKELFGCEHANVQPHSGAQANFAVYFAMLKPGDTIMGMNLSHGGHLTHGSPVNISGSYFNIVPYGVSEATETIDYDEMEKTALACKPKLIVSGASAYPRILDFKRIRAICDKVGALMMVDIAHIAGLVAAGLHPNPVPYADFVTTTTHKTLRGPRGGLILCKEKYIKAVNHAVFPGMQGGPLEQVIAAKAVCFREAMQPAYKEYAHQIVANCAVLARDLQHHGFRLVSGGTDNHLLLVDVAASGLTGKAAAAALDETGIIVNKNTIPFDKNSPFVTSGIRIGTATAATRGMKEPEMEFIASRIARVLSNIDDAAVKEEVRKEVAELASRFPVP